MLVVGVRSSRQHGNASSREVRQYLGRMVKKTSLTQELVAVLVSFILVKMNIYILLACSVRYSSFCGSSADQYGYYLIVPKEIFSLLTAYRKMWQCLLDISMSNLQSRFGTMRRKPHDHLMLSPNNAYTIIKTIRWASATSLVRCQ